MRKKKLIGTKLLATSLLLSSGIALSGGRAYATELDTEVVVADELVTEDVSGDEGQTEGNPADEGSTDEGSTDEGSTDEGSTDEGSTDEGSEKNVTGALMINEESFPDELFRKYISEFVDKDKDGALSEDEIMDVKKFSFPVPDYQDIASLQGIEVFRNLEVLSCYGNKYSEVDLSGNKELNSVEFYQSELTALDVTMLPKLKKLTLFETKVQELDLSGNPALEDLYCHRNPLKELNLSAKRKLKNLRCINNDIKTLKITSCPALVDAYEYGKANEYDLGEEDGKVIKYVSTNISWCDILVSKGVEIIDSDFTDLMRGAWYVPAVNFVKENNFMTGTSETTFKPDDTLTRSQFVKVIYNVEGMPEVEASNVFEDVADGQWYTDAVIWAATNKITSGISEKNFGTDLSITREQLATMLYRYAAGKNITYMHIEENAIAKFPDADQIDSWAKEGMMWAVTNGIMNGKKGSDDKNYLDPKGTATRAECAQMIKNLKENLMK